MSLSLRALSAYICLLAILLISGCSDNDPDQKRPPNILLILTDDLGNNDIASWGDGTAPTPTLDELSRQSLRFRRHYTDSTCSVSRAALLTGRAPVSIGFQPDGLALSADLPTLPKSLKALGYHTTHIGKWHVGEGIEYPSTWPLQQGYDQWFGMFNHFLLRGPDANGVWVQQKPTYINPWLQKDNEPARQYIGHLDDLLTDYAIDTISHSNGKQPWFVNLWLFSPHLPMEPSAAFSSKFPDTEQGRYLAVLSQLDSNIARLLKALELSGQANNTIVVFTSDNGSPNAGRDNNWPLDGIKATYKEGGVRTPLLIKWPGHMESHDIEAISSITDIYPTLMGMVGSATPKGIDGVDLVEEISGTSAVKDRELYWAADVKDWGMSYAGYLPGMGGFYLNFLNQLEQVSTTSAYLDGQFTKHSGNFSKLQASRLIRDWELQKRPIQLAWKRNPDGVSGQLNGMDFQRAPAFGPYSLGLGITKEPSNISPETLIEQEGVWRVELNRNGLLEFNYGSTNLVSSVLDWRSGCNSLVASINIQPAATYPFKAQASSNVEIYLNGKAVISSTQVLNRPQSENSFHNTTFIGINPAGNQRFSGLIGHPELVLKFLIPDQDGYNLQDMITTVCSDARMPHREAPAPEQNTDLTK